MINAFAVVPPPPLRFTLNEWHLNNRYRYVCIMYYKLNNIGI